MCVKAHKRGRRVNRVEDAHSIRVSCCRVSQAEGEEKGQGGTFLCPLRKQGGHTRTFRSPVLFSCEGAEEGQKVGGAPFQAPCAFCS